MTYARIEHGKIAEYPIYEGDIRLRFSNVSFPTPFQPPENYVYVKDVARPAYDYRKNITEGKPNNLNGVWTRNWIISDASYNEVTQRIENQWGVVRLDRNEKLSSSDWTQLQDAPVDATLWAEYRQALRDITKQTDPFNITWPQEP